MHFREWKFAYFYYNVTKIYVQGFNRHDVNIGSGKGMAWYRQQAIS